MSKNQHLGDLDGDLCFNFFLTGSNIDIWRWKSLLFHTQTLSLVSYQMLSFQADSIRDARI